MAFVSSFEVFAFLKERMAQGNPPIDGVDSNRMMKAPKSDSELKAINFLAGIFEETFPTRSLIYVLRAAQEKKSQTSVGIGKVKRPRRWNALKTKSRAGREGGGRNVACFKLTNQKLKWHSNMTAADRAKREIKKQFRFVISAFTSRTFHDFFKLRFCCCDSSSFIWRKVLMDFFQFDSLASLAATWIKRKLEQNISLLTSVFAFTNLSSSFVIRKHERST